MLEGLGLSTCDALAAAADRYNGSVDGTKLINSPTGATDSRVLRITEAVYNEDDVEPEPVSIDETPRKSRQNKYHA